MILNIININEDNLNIYQSENGLNYAFYLLDVKISPLIKNFNVNNNISGNIIIDKINNKNFDIAIKYDFKYIKYFNNNDYSYCYPTYELYF